MGLCGKFTAQPHTTLYVQFLDRENKDKNNRLPLGKQICFTIGWGCAEILSDVVTLEHCELSRFVNGDSQMKASYHPFVCTG